MACNSCVSNIFLSFCCVYTPLIKFIAYICFCLWWLYCYICIRSYKISDSLASFNLAIFCRINYKINCNKSCWFFRIIILCLWYNIAFCIKLCSYNCVFSVVYIVCQYKLLTITAPSWKLIGRTIRNWCWWSKMYILSRVYKVSLFSSLKLTICSSLECNFYIACWFFRIISFCLWYYIIKCLILCNYKDIILYNCIIRYIPSIWISLLLPACVRCYFRFF